MKLHRAFFCCFLIAMILNSLMQAAPPDGVSAGQPLSAQQVFDSRSKEKPDHVISKLRTLRQAHPEDGRIPYYLATVMIENAASDRSLREADELLEIAEVSRTPDWLAPWAALRRLQVQTLFLERIQARAAASTLTPAQRDQLVKDPEFHAILAHSLGKIEPAIAHFRQLGDSNKRDLTGDELREDLYQIKNLVSSHWAYVAEKEQQTSRSLDEVLQTSLAEVKPGMSLREGGDVIRRFVSSLLDGHAVVSVPDGAYHRALPFRLEDTPGGLIVAETLPESPFKLGDRLVAVDGVDVEEALKLQEALAFGSTVAGRRWNAVRALPAHWDGEKVYAVKVDRGGRENEVSTHSVLVGEIPWLNNKKIQSAKDWLDARMLNGDTGYLKIRTWAPMDEASPPIHSGPYLEKFRTELDTAMATLKDANDLVMDLRGNGGGLDALCAWLASYFVPDPMSIYVLRYRQMDGTSSGDGFGNVERKPASYDRQPGPVRSTRLWVLVDGGSFSATDTFLNILTRNIPERVSLIGRPSNGGIGGPKSVGTLRNTMAALTVSTCKAYSVGGELLEGAPAKIDHPIQWTRAAIEAGLDPDLEAALKLIAKEP